MYYKKILVPLDGTEFAERALPHILCMAEPDAEIHLISIVPEPAVEDIWVSINQDINDRKAYLQKIADDLRQQGHKVTCEVLPGAIIPNLLSASTHGFDLIVTTSHRRTGIGRLILGSVTESLLHKAQCPMLII
jgi:nucleotide-binding universal stress UspA family protein